MMHKINLRTIYVSICHRNCAAIRFDFLFNFASSAANLNINGTGISAVGMRSIQTDVRISRNEEKSPTVHSRRFFTLDTACRLKIITESHLKWKFCAPTSPHVETSQIWNGKFSISMHIVYTVLRFLVNKRPLDVETENVMQMAILLPFPTQRTCEACQHFFEAVWTLIF